MAGGSHRDRRLKGKKKNNRAVVGRGSERGGGMLNLVLDRFSLQCLLNLKENAPSKQVDLGMELKTEVRFGSH